MRRSAGQYRKGLEHCPHPPLRFWIEPTSHCNLRCPMCPTGLRATGLRPGLMDMALFRSVVDEISEYALDINLFFRGEGTIHPSYPEMIRYAKAKGLRVRIETNATLMRKEMADAILDAEPDFLSFSFDGYNREVYEAVRIGGKYDATIENILYFLRRKKESGKRKPFTFLQVIEVEAVRAGTSARDRRCFKRLFKGLPLDDFRIISPHRFAGSISEETTGSRYGYISKAWARFLKPRYLPCPYLWFSLVITWDGKIVPCCMDFFENEILGRAGRDSIREVWNGPEIKSLRNKIASGKYKEIKMCSDCDMLWQYSFFGISVKSMRDAVTFVREALV